MSVKKSVIRLFLVFQYPQSRYAFSQENTRMGLQSVLQCVTHVAKLDHPVKREGAAPSSLRAQELCESRRGRPGLPSLISLRFL